MDCFFGLGNPRALFKRPTKVYTLHDTVMGSAAFCVEEVTKAGAYSSSSNQDEDRLAIKIHQKSHEHKTCNEVPGQQEMTLKWKKKEASDFLAPPPASLLESWPFSSAVEPLGLH
jgi:hypothetical protein